MSSFDQRGPAPPAPCAPDSCRSWHCGPLNPLTLGAVSRLRRQMGREELGARSPPLPGLLVRVGGVRAPQCGTSRSLPFLTPGAAHASVSAAPQGACLPAWARASAPAAGLSSRLPALLCLPEDFLIRTPVSLLRSLVPPPARMPESAVAVAHARAPWDHLPSRVGLPPPGSAPPSPQGHAPALTACAQRRAPPFPAAVALRVRSSLRGRRPPPAWWSPPPPAPVGQVARAVAGFLGVASPALGRVRRGGGPVWRSEGPWASPQGAPRLVTAPASSPWPALFPEARATRRVSPCQPSP